MPIGITDYGIRPWWDNHWYYRLRTTSRFHFVQNFSAMCLVDGPTQGGMKRVSAEVPSEKTSRSRIDNG